MAIPSALGWYTFPSGTTIAAVVPSPSPGGNTGFRSIVDKWNGGVYASATNELLITGGGHNDYYGNEVYALNLTTETMSRIWGPQGEVSGTREVGRLPSESYASGSTPPYTSTVPGSRHTYGGLCYITHTDQMFMVAGALSTEGGSADPADMWLFNVTARTWTRIQPTYNTGGADPGSYSGDDQGYTACYHRVHRVVYFMDQHWLFRYDPATNTVTRITGNFDNGYHCNAVIDPVNNYYLIIGSDDRVTNGVMRISLANGLTASPSSLISGTSQTTTGSHAIDEDQYPGLTYDEYQNVVVGWNGGNNIYTLNTSTWAWTTISAYSGGQASAENGTHGRFRYVPGMNLFVCYNDIDQQAQTLRLTDPLNGADQDWLNRSTAAGVVASYGFTAAETTTQSSGGGIGIYAGANGVRGFRDTSVYCSGGGALRFDLRAGETEENISGKWTSESSPWVFKGWQFGQNTTFYVQVRFRLSPTMLTNMSPWNSGGWKVINIHMNNASNSSLEITTRYDHSGIAEVYTSAVAYHMYTTNLAYTTQSNGGPYLQQGASASSGFNCVYNDQEVGTGNGVGCFYWEGNVWYTLYYKVTLGAWETWDSRIEAWVAEAGGPFYQWINCPQYQNYNSSTSDGYNTLMLTPYMTNLTTSAPDDAYVWYDELIISRDEIALPGSTTGVQPPTGTITLSVR